MKAHLDFETFSEVDLPTAGMFKYAEHPSTEVLITSFSLDDGTRATVDMSKKGAMRKLEPLFNAINRGARIGAHNSQFEEAILEHVCQDWPISPKPAQYDCTAARAATLSLPRSLEGSAIALRLKVNKDPTGKALINKFSKPQADGSRIRSVDDPAAFDRFMEYGEQDTIVEEELDRVLPALHPYEQTIFQLDYKINKLGIPVDIPLIHKTIAFIEETSHELERRAKKLTGVKPSQRNKLLEWLNNNGSQMETLQAAEVEREIANPNTPPKIRELLESRIELSRAGTKKLATMLTCASADGRVRGGFWYHSATTGRWGSGGVQFHNLSKPEDDYPPQQILELLQKDALELFYDRPLTAIAKAVRGFVKAPSGRELGIADYSAVEPRGLAWLADEEWLLKAYRNNEDVYKIMAGQIYGIDPRSIAKDSMERFFGKQVILGAGYGMGVDKFIMTCAKFGIRVTEDQAKRAIYGYRKSVPRIAGTRDGDGAMRGGLWQNVERAAVTTVTTGKAHTICKGKLTFMVDTLPNGFEVLYIVLPSGRRLAYPEPRVENLEKWGRITPTLIFKTLFRYQWVDEETYGGKLVENIVQALCRDILANGMETVDAAGLDVILHVHDEVGAEVDEGTLNAKEFEAMVCKSRKWSRDIPIAAEGKILKRYGK